MSLKRSWDELRQDLRFAFRAMRRDTAFFAAAVAIVALGIGANTTIFSVVHGILFRPLAFQSAERLVWIANTGGADLSSSTSRVANYLDWKRMNKSFEAMAAYFAFFDYGTYTLSGSGEPDRLVGVGVTHDFLSFLGVPMALGRNFVEAEAHDNTVPAVILTHGLWQRRFGADPKILGRSLTLNGRSANVVGVLPASFDFRSVFTPGSRVDMLVPFPLIQQTDRWGNTLAVLGRLKPGVSVQQAQTEFQVLNEQIRAENKDRYTFGARLTSLQDQLTGRFRQGLVVLLCAVGVVLLIACSNLSNLLLARATSRRKEVAIRSALGASRGRLARQMLTESLVVSLVGAGLGLGLSVLAIQSLTAVRDISIPLLATVRLDGTVLLYTALAAIATGLLMGLVPALQLSATRESEALKDSGRGTSEGRRGGWARATSVVTQLAMACVLLVGAGLLIRSFKKVLEVDLGFRPERAAAWRIETGQTFSGNSTQSAFFERIVRRVETVPGVESVGLTDALPLSRDRSWGLGEKGVQYPRGKYPNGHPRIVDRRYTQTMGIALKAGRLFDEGDTADKAPVMLINEKAARQLFAGRDPIGKIVNFGGGERRVIGVVANVRHEVLESEGGLEGYIPITQSGSNSIELVVRTRLELSAVATGVRAALREVDPALPVAEYQTLEGLIDRVVSTRKFLMMLLGGFALSALVLASVGIYGVVSYGVGQRTQEIGIRLALGATPAGVRRMVMARTVALAGFGIAIGALLSLAFGKITASLLFGLEPGDIATFGGSVVVLVLVSLAAGYLPARRASRMDPMMALRSD